MDSPETSKEKDDDPGYATEPNSSPCCHNIDGRNLIVCIDGTANQYGPMSTNVVELYSLLKKQAEDDQLSWYNSGIGTYARPSWRSLKYYRQVLYHKIDLAIAWNFEKTVMGAYQWLSENYRKGDCIFLFGFSRGAFQVRVLSAMIAKVGLIHKGNALQIPFAYELYADPETSELETEEQAGEYGGPESEPPISPAERFKRTFCQDDVKVHFVGAWETVSSIGIIRNKKMLPWTTNGMKHVCFFRHALALDERRVKFLPEYAYSGKEPPSQTDEHTPAVDAKLERSKTGEPSNSNNTEPKEKKKDVDKKRYPQTKEVWFPGTHSDIGGGNRANPRLNRTRPALRWMVFEANSFGLRTNQFKRDLMEKEIIEIKESLTWGWWLFEYIPFTRLTYSLRDNEKETTHRFHRGKPRKIHPGQKIHRSVLRVQAPEDSDKEYIPQAAPAKAIPKISFFHSFFRNTLKRDETFWQRIRSSSEDQEVWIEFDLYDHVKAQLEDYISTGKADVLESLRRTAVRIEGRQALYEATMDILIAKILSKEAFVEQERHVKIVDLVKEHMSGCKLRFLPEVRNILLPVMAEKTWKDAPFSFLVELVAIKFKELNGHTSSVTSIAFSPDGGSLVSGSLDETLRVWDIHRGSQVGGPLNGHEWCVSVVAYSPDGRYIVSGSWDDTLRKWDAEKMIQVGDPWAGHSGWVTCVAFSPDGKHIVSGSDDRTFRIWDVDTGKQVGEPWSSLTRSIMCVAFSPDGALIASGSYDDSIGLWDVNTTKPVGKPLEGHSNPVSSVGFSPDGKHIVSGSPDKTIRLWDVQTGQQIGESIKGHRDTVCSVVVSPNGKLLASGSRDRTVRIWNPKTCGQVGRTLEGHRDCVQSVAFSPDGKLLASGSRDATVRTWDIEDYYTLLEG